MSRSGRRGILLSIAVILVALVVAGWLARDRVLGRSGVPVTRVVYQLQDLPATASDRLSEDVIRALQKRVDPEGVRAILWRPIGRDRIELQIASAPAAQQARAAREALAQARRRIQQLNVNQSDVLPAVRDRALRGLLKELAAGSPTRQKLFDELAAAHDQIDTSRAAGDLLAAGKALAQFEDLSQRIEETNIDVASLERLLARPGEAGGRLAAVRDRVSDVPGSVEALQQFVSALNSYRQHGASDDLTEIKRLLRGSGVLDFRILVTDELRSSEAQDMRQRLKARGPAPQAGDRMCWCRVSEEMAQEEMERRNQNRGVSFRMESYHEEYWILAYALPVVGTGDPGPRAMDHRLTPKHWALADVYPGRDQWGPNVNFRFDTQGGDYFDELSSNNIGRPVAIVLDNTVISAPNLRSRIRESGQITGKFSQADIDYLVRTLTAGSLPARLSDDPVIEESAVVPFPASRLATVGLYVFSILAVAVACVLAWLALRRGERVPPPIP